MGHEHPPPPPPPPEEMSVTLDYINDVLKGDYKKKVKLDAIKKAIG